MDRELDDQTCSHLHDSLYLFVDPNDKDGWFKWDGGLGIDEFTIKRNDLPPGTISKLNLKRLIDDDGEGRFIQIFITLGSVDHSSCEFLYDTVAHTVHTSIKSGMSYSQHKDLIRVTFELLMCLFVLYRDESPLQVQSQLNLERTLSKSQVYYRIYGHYLERRKTVKPRELKDERV